MCKVSFVFKIFILKKLNAEILNRKWLSINLHRFSSSSLVLFACIREMVAQVPLQFTERVKRCEIFLNSHHLTIISFNICSLIIFSVFCDDSYSYVLWSQFPLSFLNGSDHLFTFTKILLTNENQYNLNLECFMYSLFDNPQRYSLFSLTGAYQWSTSHI